MTDRQVAAAIIIKAIEDGKSNALSYSLGQMAKTAGKSRVSDVVSQRIKSWIVKLSDPLILKLMKVMNPPRSKKTDDESLVADETTQTIDQVNDQEEQ